MLDVCEEKSCVTCDLRVLVSYSIAVALSGVLHGMGEVCFADELKSSEARLECHRSCLR